MSLFDFLYDFTDGLGIDPEYVGEEKAPPEKDSEREEGGTPPGVPLPGSPKSEGDWGP